MLAALEQRTGVVLMKDRNAGARGSYRIRSMYFDDLCNRCYYENENGTDPREKFRIRIYNNSPERITLELKQKKMGKNMKTSVGISRSRLDALVAGERNASVLLPNGDDSDLYKKFYAELQYRNLRPVSIVSYERVPFVYRTGNVRVTFDRNICSGADFSKFFDDDLPLRPVLPCGTNLLEVKFDELLPDFIYEVLQTNMLRQTSFSKYYLCRKFNMRSTIR